MKDANTANIVQAKVEHKDSLYDAIINNPRIGRLRDLVDEGGYNPNELYSTRDNKTLLFKVIESPFGVRLRDLTSPQVLELRKSMVDLLLEKGAIINVYDKKNQTILDILENDQKVQKIWQDIGLLDKIKNHLISRGLKRFAALTAEEKLEAQSSLVERDEGSEISLSEKTRKLLAVIQGSKKPESVSAKMEEFHWGANDIFNKKANRTIIFKLIEKPLKIARVPSREEFLELRQDQINLLLDLNADINHIDKNCKAILDMLDEHEGVKNLWGEERAQLKEFLTGKGAKYGAELNSAIAASSSASRNMIDDISQELPPATTNMHKSVALKQSKKRKREDISSSEDEDSESLKDSSESLIDSIESFTTLKEAKVAEARKSLPVRVPEHRLIPKALQGQWVASNRKSSVADVITENRPSSSSLSFTGKENERRESISKKNAEREK